MNTKRLRQFLVLVPALLLAACGGGGGGGGDGGSTATALTITNSNSQAVAAEAVEVSGSYESASAGSSLVTGVQVGSASATASPVLLARAVRALVPLLPQSSAQATGVTGTATASCSTSGSVTVTASASGSGTLTAGDSFQITASNCTQGTGADAVTLNGSLSISVVSGSYDPASSVYPRTVTLRIVTSSFSVTGGGETVVSTGDLTMTLTESSSTDTSVSLSATSTSYVIGGHTVRVVNYTSQVTESAGGTTVQVSGSVESNNSRFGGGLVSYQIATITPFTVDATGAYTAGSIKVTGNASALLLTVTGTDAFTLKVDTNGDGTWDATATVTRGQLQVLV